MKYILFAFAFLTVPFFASANIEWVNPSNTGNDYVYFVGDNQTLRWSSDGNENSTATIRLRGTPDGGTFRDITIASDIPTNANSYDWKVGRTESGELVPFGEYGFYICSKSCDNTGRVSIESGAVIEVTAPSASATWNRNEPHTISWQAERWDKEYQNRAEIFFRGGPYNTRYTLVDNISMTKSSGSYTANSIPLIPDGQYTIGVCVYPGKTGCSESNGAVITLVSSGQTSTNTQTTPIPTVINKPSPTPTNTNVPLNDAQIRARIAELQLLLNQLLQLFTTILQLQAQQVR